jgi:hypothetical protein
LRHLQQQILLQDLHQRQLVYNHLLFAAATIRTHIGEVDVPKNGAVANQHGCVS